MTVKTTGAELKQFWNIELPEDQWFDDEEITVDGGEFNAENGIDVIADNALVTLSGGTVANDPKGRSVEGLFKSWRKAQTTLVLAVEVKREDEAKVRAAIAAAGAKVLR